MNQGKPSKLRGPRGADNKEANHGWAPASEKALPPEERRAAVCLRHRQNERGGHYLRRCRKLAGLTRPQVQRLLRLFFGVSLSVESIRLHEKGRQPCATVAGAYRELYGNVTIQSKWAGYKLRCTEHKRESMREQCKLRSRQQSAAARAARAATTNAP